MRWALSVPVIGDELARCRSVVGEVPGVSRLRDTARAVAAVERARAGSPEWEARQGPR